jgi:uncharacterized protein
MSRDPDNSVPPAWHTFREQADADWAAEEQAELRIREEVLPGKELPFTAPITHPEISVDRDVETRMRDGIVLRADVFRPALSGEYPVVIMRTPYNKLSSLDYGPSVMRNLARRGYVGIIQDVRGKYASDGRFHAFAGEANDGFDTVEWAAAQAWSNGRVGLWGISYAGFASIAAATARPPHLRCIMPAMIDYRIASQTSGVYGLQGYAFWHIWTNGPENNNPLRVDLDHLPLTEIDTKAGIPTPMFKAIVTVDTDLLGEMDFPPDLSRPSEVGLPTTFVAGWYDELLTGSLETWALIREGFPDARLVIGPWHHNLLTMEEPSVGQIPTRTLETVRYYEEMEALFEQHLQSDRSEGYQPERRQKSPPVKLFVMGTNQWRDEHDWPLARTRYTRFYLHSEGRSGTANGGSLDRRKPAGEERADKYDYDPRTPLAWPPSASVFEYLDTMGSCAETEARPDVLVYTTHPLEHDLEVTGPVTMTLFAATNAQDTDFVATLIDVHPNGHTQFLTNGIVRARYRRDLERAALIEPGRTYQYDFALSPTSNTFLQGHQVRVCISSSDFSRYARNQNVPDPVGTTAAMMTAHQTIAHSATYPSHITLPLIPATRPI